MQRNFSIATLATAGMLGLAGLSGACSPQQPDQTGGAGEVKSDATIAVQSRDGGTRDEGLPDAYVAAADAGGIRADTDSGTKSNKPQLIAAQLDCLTCDQFTSSSFHYDDRTFSIHWAGDRLLVAHEIGFNQQLVDLVEFQPSLATSWSHGIANGATLLSDGDDAVVLDYYNASHSLYAESLGFQDTALPYSERPLSVAVADSQLHTVTRDVNGMYHYQTGPLTGPLQEVETFDVLTLLPSAGPPTPIPIRPIDGTTTVEASAQIDGTPVNLTASSTASLNLIVAEQSIVALASLFGQGADLIWEGGSRHIGSNLNDQQCFGTMVVPYPDICPSETTTLPDRHDVVATSALFVDELANAWVAYVLADTVDTCMWSGGCIETMPCDCMQYSVSQITSASLVVERVKDPTVSIRIVLPIMQQLRPLLAGRASGGSISIAVADSGNYKSDIHIARFTAPAL